jgi:SSS family transporter
MEAYRNLIILFFVVLYMAVCVWVGVWAMRRTRSTADFFMAGRTLGVWVTGLAVFSSTLSGFGFVGGPGLVYRMGMSSVWMVICSSISYCIAFYLLGKRIRLFAELRQSISLPDVVTARYGSKVCGFLTALAIILGVIGYLASQIKAMATVLRDIITSNGWQTVSLEVCVILSSAVLVFYCVTGGIIASVYTDVIQGLVMMVAGLLVFFTALTAFDEGASAAVVTIMRDDAETLSPWGTLGMVGSLCWYFMFALGLTGQPHIVTKMMMNKRVSDAKYILAVSVMGYVLSALLWISIGLVMRAKVIAGAHPPLADVDQAAPVFLQNYTNPILAGIVFAGLFAAIMSTADSFLNIGTAAFVHDIPKAIWGGPLRRELFWARAFTILLAAMASVFALYSGDLVALLGAFGWGTFAAALVPAVAIGFNWKRATPLAVSTAIISSLVINFAVKVFNLPLPYGIDVGAISLLISLLLFFGLSLLQQPRRIDPDIEAVMDI